MLVPPKMNQSSSQETASLVPALEPSNPHGCEKTYAISQLWLCTLLKLPQLVVTVGSDGRIAAGTQRLRLARAPGSKVVRCQHPNGDITVLREAPTRGKRPEVLLHCPAAWPSAGLTAQKVQV
jgi:hypothetical protein